MLIVPNCRFDVDVQYTKTLEPGYFEACAITMLQIHTLQRKFYTLVL